MTKSDGQSTGIRSAFIKTVILGGVETLMEGTAGDPYFEALETHAADLAGLALLVARQVLPASTVIDVGANIGLSTILLARLVRKVVAYEPSPSNVALLRRNLALNGITNVEVRATAVSSNPGTLRFHLSAYGAGSHIVAFGHVLVETIDSISVPAVALDNEGLPPITFMKIDAEGHEPDILAGARRLLARDRPLIYTEINLWCLSAFAGHSPGALIRTFWRAFKVGKPEADGQVRQLPDAYQFMHDLIVRDGGMADVILRPRAGADMPTLPELTWPEPALSLYRQGQGSDTPMIARRTGVSQGLNAAAKVINILKQPASSVDRPVLHYGLAVAIGLVAIFVLFPISSVLGTGGIWATPSGDIARSLTGHLAYQSDGWQWPLLVTRMLLWPQGASVAMADSNPLFSMIAKGVSRLFGLPPINLLGAWLALCVLLQPVSAVFALRGIVANRLAASLVVAVMSVSTLAWLIRLPHINLMGHFVVLASLGLTLRMLGTGSRLGWLKAAGLLAAAVLFHPYLYLMAAAVLAAVPIEATVLWRRSALRHWTGFVLAAMISFGLFRVLNGEFDGGAWGFGFFSMNLLSPVWPQVSGLFGSTLPILTATPGQGEGFNYLGGGLLFLLAVATALLVWTCSLRPWHPGLLLVSIGLTVLALSSRIYAGQHLLLDLGEHPWSHILAAVRASGRLFWPVGYALLIGSVAMVIARLPRWPGVALLLMAALLQVVDAEPLRRRMSILLAGLNSTVVSGVLLPPGTTLVTTVPSIMCMADQVPIELATSLLLRGAREGMRLGDAGLARGPRGFGCDKSALDAVEVPLTAGETRVFLEPTAVPGLQMTRFGAEARCSQTEAVTVCSRGPTAPPGTPVTTAGVVPRLPATVTGLSGAALRPTYASGWTTDPEGVPLSSGRLATLLFALDELPTDRGVRVTLHFHPIRLDGVPKVRTLVLRAGMRNVVRIQARDGETTTASAEFTAEEATAGVFRVAFDLAPDTESFRPSQPFTISLTSLDLEPSK